MTSFFVSDGSIHDEFLIFFSELHFAAIRLFDVRLQLVESYLSSFFENLPTDIYIANRIDVISIAGSLVV